MSNKPKLEGLTAVYSQDADTCDASLSQELTIESLDGGGGTYYILKTDRWAFNSIKEINNVLTDFINRTK